MNLNNLKIQFYSIEYSLPSWLEAGYVFAPYIPMQRTPVMIDDSFEPTKGILSRYAGMTINSRYYGTITTGTNIFT